MKEKHANRIDSLLGKLGMHPRHVDPEELPDGLDPHSTAPHTPVTGPCGKTCYVSESSARKCANVPVIDDAQAAALASPRTSPAQLAKSAGSTDEIAFFRVCHQDPLQAVQLVIAEKLRHLAGKEGSLP